MPHANQILCACLRCLSHLGLQAGASAALTGLLFVAVSINLGKVLEHPQLPGRAAESLLVLVGVLIASTLGLVPGQPRLVPGGELLAVALLVWGFPIKLQLGSHRPDMPRSWIVTRVITHQIASLPMLAASVSLLAGVGGGCIGSCPRPCSRLPTR